MAATTTATASSARWATPTPRASCRAGSPWMMLVACWVVFGAIFAILAASGATKGFNIVGAIFFGTVFFDVADLPHVAARRGRPARRRTGWSPRSSRRRSSSRCCPLISLGWTVVAPGLARFDIAFFSESMRNVIGEGGGALHAIVGTLEITLMAALISVPIGLLTSIYLVEYGRGMLARGITFFVDVMTGIPSIVAGLFAYALFALFFGPAIRNGFMGAVALSVLMIPVVVRSSEEILRIVPNELREASLRARRAEVADGPEDRAADLPRRAHHRRHARRSPASSARPRRCSSSPASPRA